VAGLAGSLLVFTGLWHVFEFLMDGRRRDTLRLIPFGIVYVILGTLIVTLRGGDMVFYAALAATLVGIGAAWITRDTAEVRRWVNWVFIVVDAIIIVALVLALFS
jgi:hypothetical protein